MKGNVLRKCIKLNEGPEDSQLLEGNHSVGRSLKLWVSLSHEVEEVIGHTELMNVVRFKSCQKYNV